MTTRRLDGVSDFGSLRTNAYAHVWPRHTRSRRPARPAPRPAAVAAEPLEGRVLLAETLCLLKDVNDASVGPNPPAERLMSPNRSDFNDMTEAGGKVFFTADRAPVGRELWVTDGTQAGTRLVKDVYPGTSSSLPTRLTNVAGTLYFFASDGVHGFELWMSDGTEAGTVMVEDARPGPTGVVYAVGPSTDHPEVWTAALGNLLIFTADWNGELWRSDGTEAGTYRLKEVPRYDEGGNRQGVYGIATSNGAAYFTAPDAQVGMEVWKTDGTVAGTRLVKDVIPGPEGSGPTWFTPGAGGLTYFTATSNRDPFNFTNSTFVTDGTADGTRMILEGSRFRDAQPLNGHTYFVRMPETGPSTEVWRSDGTRAGTVKVLQFQAPPSDPGTGYGPASILGTFAGKLLLTGYTPETGREYWLSDGTQQGTRPLLETPGPANTGLHSPRVVGDALYFFRHTQANGFEPYRSDGTEQGTVLLNDIVPGPSGSLWLEYQAAFHPVAGGKVVFPAQSREPQVVVIPGRWGGVVTYYMPDLFVSDGTPAGTQKLETVPQGLPATRPETRDSMYTNFTHSGGAFYFGAVEAQGRDGLWRTDGTPAGTAPVTFGVNKVSRLTDLRGTLLFLGTGADGVAGLWRSDGTAAGTVRIREMPAPATTGPSFSDGYSAVLGDVLYFSNGQTLWRTDGTAAGTSAVRTFEDASGRVNNASNLAAAGDTVYFYAFTAAHGNELWKTDGTPAGTVIVKDINPGPASSIGGEFTVTDAGVLFFRATHPETGNEVWKTDGTAAGTVLVNDTNPGPQAQPGYGPYSLVAVGNRVYFNENTHDGPTGLWRTDGTPGGTTRIDPSRVANPSYLLALNGKVHFRAEVGPGPFPRSAFYVLDDATGALTEVANGLYGTLWPPAVLDGRAYYAGGDTVTSTDGTAEGTVRHDLNPDQAVSADAWPAVAGSGVVLFAARMPLYGREPWRIVPDGTDPAPAPREAEVVGRHVFYNNSEFDDETAGSDEDDDGAIATDKRPLRPGELGTFANVTSYSRGINGVMVDVRGLPREGLSADDFVVRSGRSPRAADLGAGPSGFTISIRRGDGAGGSDRVTLRWPDYNPASASAVRQAVANGWLQVTVLANEDTGLARPDVFLFGNLLGETGTGNTPAAAVVNATDLAAVKRNLTTEAVPVTSPYDFNKDGRVNALDIATVKSNLTRRLAMAGDPIPFAASAAPASAAPGNADETATGWLRSGS